MPKEFRELHEQSEEGRHEPSLAPVTVSMALLAVLIAAVSLLGHRAHTEELLAQSLASDQWAYYQAKNIRRHSYEIFLDQLSVFTVKDPTAVDKLREKYERELETYRGEMKTIDSEARKF